MKECQLPDPELLPDIWGIEAERFALYTTFGDSGNYKQACAECISLVGWYVAIR